MPGPLTAVAVGFQTVNLILKQLERHQNGELTDAELAVEWADMGLDLTSANDALDAAIARHRGEGTVEPT